MVEQDPLLEKKMALENEKKALIEKIKAVNRRLRYKQYEFKALSSMSPEDSIVPLSIARKRLNQLEFRIATESTNLAQERKMMREIREAEEDFSRALKHQRFVRKLEYVKGDIAAAEKEAAALDVEIKKKREQINEIERDMAARKRKAVRVKERERKEREPSEEQVSKEELKEYQQSFEKTVSLEDICVIKRKTSKKEA